MGWSGRQLPGEHSEADNCRPDRVRPWAIVSATFSAWVPGSKCCGFRHAGVSQLWRATVPAFTSPNFQARISRCVCVPCRRPSTVTFAYP
jgi:hypothetical protein